jgi:glycosyltransferase involved in cell wall biosynthesis
MKYNSILQKKKICVFYHTERSGGTKAILTLRNYKSENISFILLPLKDLHHSFYIILKNIKKIIKSDIIILNSLSIVRNPFILLLKNYFAKANKKIFIFWHSCEWHWRRLLRRKFGIFKSIKIINNKYFLKKLKELVENSINIAVSNFTAKWVKEKFFLNSKVEILYETIDFEKILRSSKSTLDFPKKEKIIIMAIGSVVPRKGFLKFLSVAERVSNEYRFVWLGTKGSYYKQIRQEIKLINNKVGYEKIQVLGFTPNPYQLLNNCDIFFLPSLEDPCAIVYLEALALGKFIICPGKRSGFSEIIQNKEGIGYIYNNINQVINLLKSPEISKYFNNYQNDRIELAKKFDEEYFKENLFEIISRYI